MESINIYLRYRSYWDVDLLKIATMTREGELIFNDQARHKTVYKFSLITAFSPLITIVRLVRSVVFFFSGDPSWARREFIGALATPILAAGCLVGTLLSALVDVITERNGSAYISMRRAYALFEAWINGTDIYDPNLPSYSSRVSSPTSFTKRIWMTAPCLQPLLEHGVSNEDGLLDVARVQKMFPHLKISEVQMEGDDVVIEIEYSDETHFVTSNEAFEYRKRSTVCCKSQVEKIDHRILCCEVSITSCTSLDNPDNHCGTVTCGACGLKFCSCCYAI